MPSTRTAVRVAAVEAANKQHYKREINDTIMQRLYLEGEMRSPIAIARQATGAIVTHGEIISPRIIFSLCHLRKCGESVEETVCPLNYSGLLKSSAYRKA